jgi:hypothetical protein
MGLDAFRGPQRHPFGFAEPTAYEQLPTHRAFQNCVQQRVITPCDEVQSMPSGHEARVGLTKVGQGVSGNRVAPCQLLGRLWPGGRIGGVQCGTKSDQSLWEQPGELIPLATPIHTRPSNSPRSTSSAAAMRCSLLIEAVCR